MERRSHARYARTFELEGKHPTAGEHTRMVAENLSLGGLYCTSSTPFDEMTRLAVRLMLPAEGEGADGLQPIEVEAVVVRQQVVASKNGESYRLALFFTHVGDADRQRLANFIAAG